MIQVFPNRLSFFYKYLFHLLLTYLMAAWTLANAQSKYQFRHLDLQDGLLDNTVFSILQDKEGFFWFGTSSGLQRYDGYAFINFKYDPKRQDQGLHDNIIRHLMQASDGTIWIGTEGGGVSRYKDGKLLPPILEGKGGLSGNSVESIVEDTRGGIWIGTSQGLDYLYKDKITHFKHDPKNKNSISDNRIYSMLVDKKGNLWVGTREGLNLYLGNHKFKRYFYEPQDTNTISGNFIHDIFEDSQGDIWLAIPQGGISRLHFTARDTMIHRYTHNPSEPKSLSHNIALDITEDTKGDIWIATWGGGLNRFSQGSFEHFRSNHLDPTSIASDNVEELYLDQNGNLWTVNYTGGVNQFLVQTVEAYTYQALKEVGMLPTETIMDLIISRDSALWIASHEGINRYKDGKFEQFRARLGDRYKISNQRPNFMFEDSKGRIWISYDEGGVDMIENEQLIPFRHDPADPNSIAGNQAFVLEEDSEGNIWISCPFQGISIYQDGKFVNYRYDPNNPDGIHSNIIEDFWPGDQGDMWIASRDKGLAYYKDGKYKVYQHDPKDKGSLPSNSLRCLVVDKEKRVWVSFVGGIARLDPKTQKFTLFTEEDGIPNPYVDEMALDENGIVWIATHNGAARFMPETQKFESFSYQDGFTDTYLKTLKKSPFANKMYFGGKGGVYAIDVDELEGAQVESQALNLVFTNFELLRNKDDSLTQRLRRQFLAGKAIQLNYQQNTFDIKFAALSSKIRPSHNYEYRLRKKDAPDADWISIGNQNKISFSYLVPGQYVFELRVSDFGKSSSRRSIPITILPPWWQTLWFRVLIVAAFIAASYSYYRFQLRNVQKRNEKLEKVVQERTVELREAHSEVLTQAEELQQQAEELSTQRDYLADSQKELARKNQLIQNSIRAAQTIQKAVLPSPQKLENFIPEHFVFYRPRDIVSGDFYWHSAVSRSKQGQQVHYLATVDCTGHGIPGAFMTLIGTTLLDKIIAHAHHYSPSEITESLDEEVRILLKQETGANNYGMDLSLIAWEPYPDNQICLTFCGAKSDLYYFKDGDSQLHKVKGDRRSLGGLKNTHTLFSNQKIILPPGSMVYMGTDGYIDQNNVRRKRLGNKRFEKLLLSIRDQPLVEQKEILESSLKDYMKNTEQRDDILVLGFRV